MSTPPNAISGVSQGITQIEQEHPFISAILLALGLIEVKKVWDERKLAKKKLERLEDEEED